MQRRMAAGSSFADTTITGTPGKLRAHIHQTGKAARARHGEIKQHKIDIAAAFEQFNKFVVSAGFGYVHALQQASHRFAQCATKQGMVVGNDQPVRLE